MIYEIRNYHFDPDHFDDYKIWATNEALPYLRSELDILGFWVDCGIPADVTGTPMDDLGGANISWVIRWDDMDQRNERWNAVIEGSEFQGILARVPGGLDSYKRLEARFHEAL